MFTLTWCIFLPLVTAAILLLIPSGWKGLIKSVSVLGAVLTFIISIGLYNDYKDEDGVIMNDAGTVLSTAQESILGNVQWKDVSGLPFPAAGKGSFSPKEYEAAIEQVRALAVSENARDDAVRVWKQALELHYAKQAKATEHLGHTEWVPWISLFNVNYFLAVDG